MKPYYEADGISIYHADCRDVDVSGVSAVVTDPPYGLEFMGKGWDKGVPGVEFWDRFAGSCWPGAHLVAFGGTRTHHRLMCAIEDSGWEIRDCLMWLYGSGFPKSLDVGKAIDKAAAAEREDMGPGQWAHVKAGGTWKSNVYGDEPAHGEGPRASKPASDAAKQWDGWGTALKPAWEPIVLARKPLPGTVAANVQEYGTGAINVDGCRILAPPGDREEYGIDGDEDAGRNRTAYSPHNASRTPYVRPTAGRFPANLLLDEEAATILDEQSGESQSVRTETPQTVKTSKGRKVGSFGAAAARQPEGHPKHPTLIRGGFSDLGGASRFFYCAKASRSERNTGDADNTHPTVKPVDLVMWLIRLITPPGGLILDSFMGSGTTIFAAHELNFPAIGIDKDEESCETAAKRLSQGVLDLGAAT